MDGFGTAIAIPDPSKRVFKIISELSVAPVSLSNVHKSGKDPFGKVVARQYGVFSRQQALQLGLTKSMLQYRLRRNGPWQVVLPGVYLTTTGQPTVDQRDMAAQLYGGPSGVITGIAALRRHGVRCEDSFFVDVLVPKGVQRVNRSYVRVRETRRMPATVAGHRAISFTFAPRAVADAARWMSDLREVRAVICGAVQQGRCPVGLLAAELAEPRLPGSALARRVLAEVNLGIRSPAEGDLLDLIRSSPLPQPLYNPRLYLGKSVLAVPDAWWPQAAVAVEVDSREWHLAVESWHQTMDRHARMTAVGIAVLHYPPSQIRETPGLVVAQITAALRNGRPVEAIRTVPA